MNTWPSEADISSTWEQGTTEVVVSICCTTFNQEAYIENALQSFLCQVTRFPFEILVHDDASTDRTVDIIQAYQKKYPNLIRPIFQKQNQFSKGQFKPTCYTASFSHAKYIALCEGDDYWVDSNKLQLQFDVMEEWTSVDFSFHAAYKSTNETVSSIASWFYGDSIKLFDAQDIANLAGQFAPTASYMLRREVILNMPEWFFKIAPIGDIFLELYGANRGGALYIPQPLSVYRVKAINSWHNRNKKGSKSRADFFTRMIESVGLIENSLALNRMNLKRAVLHCGLALDLLLQCDDTGFRNEIYKSVEESKNISFTQFILYQARHFPTALRIFYKLRNFFG